MSAKTIRVILIPTETAGVEEDIESTLETYQCVVGGHIEAVLSRDSKTTLFVNETGKLDGLPVNALATTLWWLLNPAMTGVDTLCGPAIVTGGPDSRGATTSVPRPTLKLWRNLRDAGHWQ